MRALPLTARPASADGLADSHRTGCLSQFCASKGIATTCEYLCRYACQAVTACICERGR